MDHPDGRSQRRRVDRRKKSRRQSMIDGGELRDDFSMWFGRNRGVIKHPEFHFKRDMKIYANRKYRRTDQERPVGKGNGNRRAFDLWWTIY